MRSSTEAKAVVARAGRYAEVHPKSDDRDDPSPLKVKEVWVEDARRYVVCVNEDQATKDRHDREAVVASLRDALGKGDKSSGGQQRVSQVPARGKQAVRRRRGQDQGGSALRRQVGADDEHGAAGARGGAEVQATVDGGGCVPLDEIAAGYPADLSPSATKRFAGTCFARSWRCCCARNCKTDWRARSGSWSGPTSIRDLDNLIEMKVAISGKGYVFRGQTSGVAGKVFQACGVALPPALRPC